MNELKPNEQRGKIAASMIWLVLIMQALMTICYLLQLYVAVKISEGKDIPETLAYISDYGIGLTSILYLVAFIISGITFILWFRRAYYNLRAITHDTL